MSSTSPASRRQFLLGGASLAAVALSGCAIRPSRMELGAARTSIPEKYREIYGPVYGEPFPIPAVNLSRLDEKYWRQVVDDPTGERPGTIVVSTSERFLYLVRDGGKAMRYGVGIGREGFSWSGRGYIAYKREWPTWTPPAAMIEREPYLEEFRNGMPPGPENPLGARALYIFEDGRDTLYRLHGNPDETSIGRAVSSGCVRLLQQDVIDLYGRVSSGAPIKVI